MSTISSKKWKKKNSTGTKKNEDERKTDFIVKGKTGDPDVVKYN